MPKIKRKVSKRRPKTRRNCAPCLGALNPGYKGIRRRNPSEKFYVYYDITDLSDQPSEHESYLEAVEKVRDLQKKGFKNARIVGPGCMPEFEDY